MHPSTIPVDISVKDFSVGKSRNRCFREILDLEIIVKSLQMQQYLMVIKSLRIL